jgi:hypothetical protein
VVDSAIVKDPKRPIDSGNQSRRREETVRIPVNQEERKKNRSMTDQGEDGVKPCCVKQPQRIIV